VFHVRHVSLVGVEFVAQHALLVEYGPLRHQPDRGQPQVGHVDHYGIGAEEDDQLKPKRRLIVEEPLPEGPINIC